jgi:hypothetical protein
VLSWSSGIDQTWEWVQLPYQLLKNVMNLPHTHQNLVGNISNTQICMTIVSYTSKTFNEFQQFVNVLVTGQRENVGARVVLG